MRITWRKLLQQPASSKLDAILSLIPLLPLQPYRNSTARNEETAGDATGTDIFASRVQGDKCLGAMSVMLAGD
jgi:hypothetical protein